MTVKELRKKLLDFPQNTEVYIYSESDYLRIGESESGEFFLDRDGDLILFCDIDPKWIIAPRETERMKRE